MRMGVATDFFFLLYKRGLKNIGIVHKERSNIEHRNFILCVVEPILYLFYAHILARENVCRCV